MKTITLPVIESEKLRTLAISWKSGPFNSFASAFSISVKSDLFFLIEILS